MNDSSTIPYLHLGGAFVIGLSLGYLLKKTFKIGLFVLGVVILILFGAEHYGLITINETGLTNMVDSGMEVAKTTGSFIQERLSTFTAKGVTAVAGFVTGLKIG